MEQNANHSPSCRCPQCRVLRALYEDGQAEIEAAAALMVLIPLTCAFLAHADDAAAGGCLEFMRTIIPQMKRRGALLAEWPAAGCA